jgi:selenocysteine lyase/cysteine desulfurase
MATIDIAAVRRDTPSCNELAHFNNAGASLQPLPVTRAVLDHLALEQAIGGYEAEDRAAATLEGLYASLARLIGAEPDEMAFVENATRAWDMAFYSIPFEAGDRILTCRSEYVSNYLAFLQLARRKGIIVDVVPDDESGQIDVEALERLIEKRTRLIAMTHVPTQGGLVNPAEHVGRVARAHNVLYLLDACQSVGQMPIDVGKIGCDMLSATGRKFLRGPRGTGFLYVSRRVLDRLDPVFVDLHAATWTARDAFRLRDDARRFENWESFVAGRLGLAAAADYAMALGIDAIEKRNRYLSSLLREGLSRIPSVSIHDLGRRKCAIVTFRKHGVACTDVRDRLRAARINVSVSGLTSARLDFEARNLTELVRASVHYFNTEAEIDRLCEAVAAV